MTWMTRLHHLPKGAPEIHMACFEPQVMPKSRPTLNLLLPECELQYVECFGKAPVGMVNRPQQRRPRYWFRFACAEATRRQAFLMISCDTAEDLERTLAKVGKLLPNHRRVALERMYEFAPQGWGRMS